MKNKLILLLLVTTILFTVFSACGDNSNTGGTTGNEIINQGSISQETTVPSEETVNATFNLDEMSYIQFNALSFAEKDAIMKSFDSFEDFVKWRDELKKFHDEFNEKIHPQQGTENNPEPTVVDTNPEVNDTTPGVKDTEPTIDETTNESTAPTETEPEAKKVTFLEYQAMSGAEQKKFINSFESIDAFMAWHAAAIKEYKDNMAEFGPGMSFTNPGDLTEPTKAPEPAN